MRKHAVGGFDLDSDDKSELRSEFDLNHTEVDQVTQGGQGIHPFKYFLIHHPLPM